LIWRFPNFVFIDFLDELGLFTEQKPIFTKKKIRRSAVCCRISNILVLRGAYCFFSHFDDFHRVAPKQKFGYFKFLIDKKKNSKTT
jgi:hypothetical protein